MMMPTSPARLNDDSKLIARHLLSMAMPRLIRRAIVIGIAIVLWLFICRALLSFGAGVRYDALIVFGQQAVDLLNRINPYLWWAVVVLVTLVMFFALRGWYVNSLRAGRATPVEPATLRELSGQLSADSLKVLHWVWRDHDEPLTVGDLQLTLSELRHGRVRKIYLAREQEAALLGQATTANATGTGRHEPLAAAPVLTEAADRGPAHRGPADRAARPVPAEPFSARPAPAAPVPPAAPAEPTFVAHPRSAPAHAQQPAGRSEPGFGQAAPERRAEPHLPDPDRR